MKEDTMKLLSEPFPVEVIRTRRGHHGKELRYLETWRVIERLNGVFGADWSFHIKELKILDEEVLVKVEISAGPTTKSAFGGATITRGKETDQAICVADDVKAACSDALKKGATLFGIGLELYADRTEEQEKPAMSSNRTPQDGREAPGGNGKRLTQRQFKALTSMSEQVGLSEQGLETWVQESFGCPIAELGRKDASELISDLHRRLAGGNGGGAGGPS